MKILQRKVVQRKFGLDIFKLAPLFFLKFVHIDELLLYFMKITCFFFIFITLYVEKYVIPNQISHISLCGNGRHCEDIMKH